MELSKFEENHDGVQRLYEASMEGSVTSLKCLLQNDPLILSKTCLTSLGETPLHVSVLLGHLDFTLILLSQKPQGPQLAAELDFLKRSPLHLASAKGHVEIVEALLQVNKEMCIVRDEDGKIPLHYAAMRGRVEVIKLLINAQPESIFVVVLPDYEETVLHLCIQYNHLEALKLLVEYVGYENHGFLNSKESLGGYTILHLAVLLKQLQSIKYLVTIPGVKAEMSNAKDKMNLTALNMVQQLPKYLKGLKIQQTFVEAGLLIPNNNNHTVLVDETKLVVLESSTHTSRIELHGDDHKKKRTNYIYDYSKKILNFLRKLYKWIDNGEYDQNLLENTSGSIMIVSTVIATMSFQAAITPPGGLWQETTPKNNTCLVENECRPIENDYCSQTNPCLVGTAVAGYVSRNEYSSFLACNTISFLTSLSVILLLVSGAPVKNKLCMWILAITMCIALTFLVVTFILAIYLVSPSNTKYNLLFIFIMPIYIWLVLLCMVSLFLVIRFFIWAVKKLRLVLKKFRCIEAPVNERL